MTAVVDGNLVTVSISIHTPAKGVTESVEDFRQAYDISIHTPAKGVTIWLLNVGFATEISIHTPAKGVTALYCRT